MKKDTAQNKGQIFLGTSGWTYDHWKGIVYPDSIARKQWFEYYCTLFPTVEINASFYRIPTRTVTESWARRSPEHFRFSVKVSRLITHVKKIKNCDREIEWFFSVFEPLEKKIALYLVQLPPNLNCDPGRLHDFIRLLPQNKKYAFEFRNTTWYNDEIVDLLRETECTFCIHDMGELKSARITTSGLTYVRFHGFDTQYGGDYSDQTLTEWAHWMQYQAARGISVYGYFNNDIGGFAVKNCRTLQQIIRDYK